jgi:transcriptional regulator with XRE-family HTH domain
MQNEITSVQIGKNLKSLRHKQGWNQATVAAQLNISTPAYSKIESGMTIINMHRLKQMAGLYNVTTLELMTPNIEPGTAANSDQILDLKRKISELDAEIIKLQVRAIELYEEVRNR